MSNWLRHITLMAQARTGAGVDVAVWLTIAVVSLLAGLLFFAVAAFIWLARRFDGVIAGLILGGAFMLIAIVALIAARLRRSHIIEGAQRELAPRPRANRLDPGFAPILVEIGRAVGWRKLAALGAVALLALGAVREWTGGRADKPDDTGVRD
jgi:hypothetical protein